MTVRDDRFAPRSGGTLMKAVVTTGLGGLEKLEYRDVPMPALGPGDILVRVLAAGLNNVRCQHAARLVCGKRGGGHGRLLAAPPERGREAGGKAGTGRLRSP